MQFDNLRIVKTEITYEPLVQDLPPEMDVIKHQVFALGKSKSPKIDAQKLLDTINLLIEKYPENPMLSNWKYVVCARLDYSDNQLNIQVIENYKKFPDYLFAKCDYAQLCLKNNDGDKVPEIFGNNYIINDIYPDRKIFHATECITFAVTMGEYFCYKKDFNLAKNSLELICQINSKHPFYKSLLLKIMKTFPEEKGILLPYLLLDLFNFKSALRQSKKRKKF